VNLGKISHVIDIGVLLPSVVSEHDEVTGTLSSNHDLLSVEKVVSDSGPDLVLNAIGAESQEEHGARPNNLHHFYFSL